MPLKILFIVFLPTLATAALHWENAPIGLLNESLKECTVFESNWTDVNWKKDSNGNLFEEKYTVKKGATPTVSAEDDTPLQEPLKVTDFFNEVSAIPGGYGLKNIGENSGARIWFYSPFYIEVEQPQENVEYAVRTVGKNTAEGGQGLIEIWHGVDQDLFLKTSAENGEKTFTLRCLIE